MKLGDALTKDSLLNGEDTSHNAVDGTVSDTNLAWDDCLHYSDAASPWWAVDLGSVVMVAKVKLYACNGGGTCNVARLQGLEIYLGYSWNSYAQNTLVAQAVDVSQNGPLEVVLNADGQYLWVARPGQTGLTLCEIQASTQ